MYGWVRQKCFWCDKEEDGVTNRDVAVVSDGLSISLGFINYLSEGFELSIIRFIVYSIVHKRSLGMEYE